MNSDSRTPVETALRRRAANQDPMPKGVEHFAVSPAESPSAVAGEPRSNAERR